MQFSTRQPFPAHDLNSAVPRSLVAVITKALKKDREKRYQSASELKNDLERLAQEANPAKRRTWQAHGDCTVALVAVGIWRYDVYRHRITLAPTDTIVLADVDNRTDDPVFDDALNTALRYEMEQMLL